LTLGLALLKQIEQLYSNHSGNWIAVSIANMKELVWVWLCHVTWRGYMAAISP
jgi:hypothetical protein